ncbi:MAG TPA: hotdog fold domain-containing protein [Gemmatimonadales bacterium]
MTNSSPGARLRASWDRLSRLPGGRWLFSRLLRFVNPYSGAVGARVEELQPGHARLTLTDRRAVRNHLNSVHAIALANIAELASGLAMLSALPDTVRGIPTGISIQYLKKARGVLTAEARVVIPTVTGDMNFEVTSTVKNAAGEEVAHATVSWKLGLIPGR